MSETAGTESAAVKKAEAEAEAAASDERFFKSCYGTIGLSTAPVALAWLTYYSFYAAYFADRSEQTQLSVLAIGIGLFIIIATNLLVGGAAFGVDLRVPDGVRNAFLPIAASLLVADLAIICSVTGGTASPFTHILTAVGGLAILYATKFWTRALILTSVIVAFYQSGIHFIAPCTSTNFPCPGTPPELPRILWFHCGCLVLVGALSVLAVTREPPRRKDRRKGLAMTSPNS